MSEKLTLEQMKANRKLWVEALRSGRYEQGKTFLRATDNTFCCLGVLTDLAGCGWDSVGAACYYTQDGVNADAPFEAMAFVGLATTLGDFGETSLAMINDSGAGFPEIADIIESEPDGLFIDEEPAP